MDNLNKFKQTLLIEIIIFSIKTLTKLIEFLLVLLVSKKKLVIL